MKQYIIVSTEDGYRVEYYYGESGMMRWIAPSWAVVIEILSEIGAPDFVPEAEVNNVNN